MEEEEDQIVLAGGYGLAALCMQMALLNALSGQGGVPVAVIDQVIERAKGATGLIADTETTPGMECLIVEVLVAQHSGGAAIE